MHATTLPPASLHRPVDAEDTAPVTGDAGGQATVAAVDSSALLQGRKAVAIIHNGALYRLQATKLGKLILTK